MLEDLLTSFKNTRPGVRLPFKEGRHFVAAIPHLDLGGSGRIHFEIEVSHDPILGAVRHAYVVEGAATGLPGIFFRVEILVEVVLGSGLVAHVALHRFPIVYGKYFGLLSLARRERRCVIADVDVTAGTTTRRRGIVADVRSRAATARSLRSLASYMGTCDWFGTPILGTTGLINVRASKPGMVDTSVRSLWSLAVGLARPRASRPNSRPALTFLSTSNRILRCSRTQNAMLVVYLTGGLCIWGEDV
ncbi:hypothetical protein F4819DRAFT_457029 [Hypoxylon fuscum]|nr:hypothetical protein F4819DRAFT_457029 [Hypoxylon fuscum]